MNRWFPGPRPPPRLRAGGRSRGARSPRNQVLREMKQSVRRDLENLLNTRRRCGRWPAEPERAGASRWPTTAFPTSRRRPGPAEGREEFRQISRRIHPAFEPRFKSVTRRAARQRRSADRTLRFRIDALSTPSRRPSRWSSIPRCEPATGQRRGQGSRPMSDELLPYYNRELTFIRRLGAEFAEAHPEDRRAAAARGRRAEDPHVERLIEAFAFSTPASARSSTTSSPSHRRAAGRPLSALPGADSLDGDRRSSCSTAARAS